MFAGQVKIVSHSSCRTSAILNFFCRLLSNKPFGYAGITLSIVRCHTVPEKWLEPVSIVPGTSESTHRPFSMFSNLQFRISPDNDRLLNRHVDTSIGKRSFVNFFYNINLSEQ